MTYLCDLWNLLGRIGSSATESAHGTDSSRTLPIYTERSQLHALENSEFPPPKYVGYHLPHLDVNCPTFQAPGARWPVARPPAARRPTGTGHPDRWVEWPPSGISGSRTSKSLPSVRTEQKETGRSNIPGPSKGCPVWKPIGSVG